MPTGPTTDETNAAVQTPIGSIMAYAGPLDVESFPAGWLLCDGDELDRTENRWKPLWNVIGTSWGGTGAPIFNLPDLQGYFLRGVDRATNRDPEAHLRKASKAGGNIKDSVGSVQTAATRFPATPTVLTTSDKAVKVDYHRPQHIHEHVFSTGHDQSASLVHVDVNGSAAENPAVGHGHTVTITAADGDAETRSLNAYVHWIIKYR